MKQKFDATAIYYRQLSHFSILPPLKKNSNFKLWTFMIIWEKVHFVCLNPVSWLYSNPTVWGFTFLEKLNPNSQVNLPNLFFCFLAFLGSVLCCSGINFNVLRIVTVVIPQHPPFKIRQDGIPNPEGYSRDVCIY